MKWIKPKRKRITINVKDMKKLIPDLRKLNEIAKRIIEDNPQSEVI